MGWIFLIGYVLIIGVATFLMKVALKDTTPFQLNLLMGIGMLLTGVPALWLAQKNLKIPLKEVPMGLGIGVAMAVGSLLFVLAINKLPAGLTAAVASCYIVVVAILSWLLLKESFDVVKALGLILTLGGVAILAYKS